VDDKSLAQTGEAELPRERPANGVLGMKTKDADLEFDGIKRQPIKLDADIDLGKIYLRGNGPYWHSHRPRNPPESEKTVSSSK
jgi:hypothetical protein